MSYSYEGSVYVHPDCIDQFEDICTEYGVTIIEISPLEERQLYAVLITCNDIDIYLSILYSPWS